MMVEKTEVMLAVMLDQLTVELKAVLMELHLVSAKAE
jgi:hypothetical protein